MFIRFPPRRILVPLDFSPPSTAALEAAQALGAMFSSDLELVHVVEPLPQTPVGEPTGSLLGLAAASRQARASMPATRKKLLAAASAYPEARLKARCLLGSAPETISSLAVPKQTDMVVMGTHGYSGLERVIYGSVAEAVAARSRVPVLAVRKRQGAFALRNVLCPVNLTPYAAVALSYAALMAQAAGASLTAAYVRPETVWQEDAKSLLSAFLRECLGPSALAVEPLTPRGEPREEIARLARRGPFDLVVLSAHSRPWTTDALLGATAQRVLRSSSVPVLTVPARAKRAKRPDSVWPSPDSKILF